MVETLPSYQLPTISAGEDESVWRASAMNTVTKERSYFATEQELVTFLGLSDSDKEGMFPEGTLEL